jgi:hypothetical protein
LMNISKCIHFAFMAHFKMGVFAFWNNISKVLKKNQCINFVSALKSILVVIFKFSGTLKCHQSSIVL